MNETDWNLLNKFADDEMQPSEAEEFAARIDREPGLRDALAELIETKASLKKMYRDELALPSDLEQEIIASQQDQRKGGKNGGSRKLHALSFAAGIACAVAIYGVVQYSKLGSNALATEIAGIHDELSAKSYVVESRELIKLAPGHNFSSLTVPDLRPSSLYFVSLDETRDHLALHYRGMNGCSLTVIAREKDESRPNPSSLDSAGDHMMEAWHGRDYDFAVVSQGMDKNRFESIFEFIQSDFLQQQIRRDELRIAMGDAYENSVPCV